MTRKLKECSDCGKEVKSVSKKEFDRMLKACFEAPPLRLKDLREQLREEREARKKSL
jgi:hypothetical protein